MGWILGAPFALASFILAIVCMAKNRIAHGLINLVAIVIGMPLAALVGIGVLAAGMPDPDISELSTSAQEEIDSFGGSFESIVKEPGEAPVTGTETVDVPQPAPKPAKTPAPLRIYSGDGKLAARVNQDNPKRREILNWRTQKPVGYLGPETIDNDTRRRADIFNMSDQKFGAWVELPHATLLLDNEGQETGRITPRGEKLTVSGKFPF
ncbi:hypothetical protein N8622_02310 [bacterium]|nr:hypothetical protein [bacterium]